VNDVAIIGVGMTKFAKDLAASVRSLAERAVRTALADATLESGRIEAAFFSNAIAGLVTGQEMIRGEAALRNTGLSGIPMFNVENACASGSSAMHLACLGVASGVYELVLVIGAEKMTHEDKSVPFSAIGTAMDLETRMSHPEYTTGGPTRSPFMDLYASRAIDYMRRTGTTVQSFADVAVKNHLHGLHNPYAQYRVAVTRQEVLESRDVVPPLRLLMCAPIGDGAAAAVVCSRDVVKRLGLSAPIWVKASVLQTGRDRGPTEPTVVRRAAAAAYEAAGVAPTDVDVIELHDATAPAELFAYEDLALCEAGDAASLLASRATSLGGRVPVNPSGGLLSKGHPIGATGVAQIVELVWQLRSQAEGRQVEGARLGMAENAGGSLGTDTAAASVHILAA
jgi:acetyl-CoA acetyltransferase